MDAFVCFLDKAHSFQPIKKILLEEKIYGIPVMNVMVTLLQIVHLMIVSVL